MKQLSIALLTILLATNVFAQFSVDANISIMNDDNIDNNYLKIADRITSASVKTGYGWSSDQTETGLFYTGAFNYFSQTIDRTFFAHQLNFDYEQIFGEEDASTFYAKTGFFTRLDRADYTFYDHQIYNGLFQLQHFFTETTKGEGAYTFNHVRFKELSDFNYSEHILSTKGSVYFNNTQTTVIALASIGSKIYSTANYDSTMASGAMGRGRKQTDQSSPSVTQLIGMVRVGQSIFENTGLSLTAQYQWNIQKESRYLVSEYGSLSDDAIFDDHYGYEGLQLSTMLTQVLPFDARLRITVSTQNKTYSNLTATDLAGNFIADQRIDKRSTLTLQLTKEFETLGISLNAAYDYIVNSSNDPFYNYTNRAISVNVAFGF